MVSGDSRAMLSRRHRQSNVVVVAPAVDAHDQSQGTMLLGEVLEPVVVEVAAEPDGPQDEDRPVVHPRTAAVGAAWPR